MAPLRLGTVAPCPGPGRGSWTRGSGDGTIDGSGAAAGEEAGTSVPTVTRCSARGAAGPALASPQQQSSGVSGMASAPSPSAAHPSRERGPGHGAAGHPGQDTVGLGAGEGHGHLLPGQGPRGGWWDHPVSGVGLAGAHGAVAAVTAPCKPPWLVSWHHLPASRREVPCPAAGPCPERLSLGGSRLAPVPGVSPRCGAVGGSGGARTGGGAGRAGGFRAGGTGVQAALCTPPTSPAKPSPAQRPHEPPLGSPPWGTSPGNLPPCRGPLGRRGVVGAGLSCATRHRPVALGSSKPPRPPQCSGTSPLPSPAPPVLSLPLARGAHEPTTSREAGCPQLATAGHGWGAGASAMERGVPDGSPGLGAAGAERHHGTKQSFLINLLHNNNNN